MNRLTAKRHKEKTIIQRNKLYPCSFNNNKRKDRIKLCPNITKITYEIIPNFVNRNSLILYARSIVFSKKMLI